MKQHKLSHPFYDRGECGTYGVVFNYDGTMTWEYVTCPKCLERRNGGK